MQMRRLLSDKRGLTALHIDEPIAHQLIERALHRQTRGAVGLLQILARGQTPARMPTPAGDLLAQVAGDTLGLDRFAAARGFGFHSSQKGLVHYYTQ